MNRGGGHRCCIECRNWHAGEVVVDDGTELRRNGDGELAPIPKMGECRAAPPRTFMLPLQGARLDGKTGVDVRFPAAWPQTQPLAWCGAWRPKHG